MVGESRTGHGLEFGVGWGAGSHAAKTGRGQIVGAVWKVLGLAGG